MIILVPAGQTRRAEEVLHSSEISSLTKKISLFNGVYFIDLKEGLSPLEFCSDLQILLKDSHISSFSHGTDHLKNKLFHKRNPNSSPLDFALRILSKASRRSML